MHRILFVVASFSCLDGIAETVTFENVVPPSSNKSDEPIAAEFSSKKAIHFLDSASIDWTKSRKCFTCHTNYAYLLVKPMVSNDDAAHQGVRAALDEMVNVRWEKQGPRWDAEVIMSAMVLAFNDAATSNKLHETTKKALDRMWTVQKEHGGFDWLKCGWPPMESDDEYGASIALLAAGIAPENYKNTDQAKAGIANLKKYLSANRAPTLHHEAMLLWASTMVDDIMTDEQSKSVVTRLLELQKADGGWCLATLGNWERSDEKEQDEETSDGYATGFVIYVLRQAGISKDDAQIQKGLNWLKKNQRASGRWFTRSLNSDNKHFISHAGTSFAMLAIHSCDSPTK